MKIRYSAYSNRGGRPNNEDSLCAVNLGEFYLFAVADGLGGHDCGEVASAIAAEELEKRFRADPAGFDLEEAILSANQLILERQQQDGLQMKTTVTAAYISPEKTVIANVGDSRTYAFSGQTIVFQSLDHSASQMAVSVGEITPDQIRMHEDRNILTRALGSTSKLKVDLSEIPTAAYDSLLLSSDGFWEYVLEGEMTDLKEKNQKTSDWLMSMREILITRVPKNHDNNTAIVVKKEQ